jgi:hypothetical protein
MSRLFTAITVLVLILVLAIPAFARENAPAITDGTSNTIMVGITGITDGTSNTVLVAEVRAHILPYIEQDN